jgi:serine/threonine-protein kinase
MDSVSMANASGQLAPGTLLQGSTYRVVGSIGKGAMGEVYEVSHARLSGRYALKLLGREATVDPEFLQRFKREAQVVSALRHPHIVQVIDFDQTGEGRPYLVMEMLEGENLAARLDQEGPLPLSRVVPIVKQIASALAAAHARGVVHRDLKPENVILVRMGGHDGDFAKLVDFGISKVMDASVRLTGVRTIIGTPHYMAPEQARSHEVDHRADQFALAAITYELLSGELAFVGEDVAAVAYQVAHCQPPRLAEPGGWISPGVDAVLATALAKSPGDRFPSISEFADALELAARGVADARVGTGGGTSRATVTRHTVSDEPGAASQPRPRPPRAIRRIARAIAALTVVSAFLGGALWTLVRGRSHPAAALSLPATSPSSPATRASLVIPSTASASSPAPAARQVPEAWFESAPSAPAKTQPPAAGAVARPASVPAALPSPSPSAAPSPAPEARTVPAARPPSSGERRRRPPAEKPQEPLYNDI